MITRQPLVPDKQLANPIVDYSFNQNQTCLILSTNKTFQIFNVHPLKHIMGQEMSQITKIRMLHRTNYIAFISSGRNILHIWDDVKKRDIVRLKLNDKAKQLFLSREFIVVGQADHTMSVYRFGTPWDKFIPDIKYGGVCEFAQGILVYSNEFNLGQIHITRLQNENDQLSMKVNIVKAHATPIKMVRLNKKGDMVATCSMDGTIIRVYQTETGVLVKELRRGLDRALILEMCWSPNGSKLAVVSDKWTLHVFEIFNDSENQRHVLKNWINMKYFQSEWSLCNYKLNIEKGETSCKIAWIDDLSLAIVWPSRQLVENYKVVHSMDMEKWSLQLEQSNQITLL